MKSLALILLIANVLFFIWSQYISNNTYVPPPLVDKGIPSLTLLPLTSQDAYQSKGSNRQSSCYTFGPFNSEKTARYIASKINDYGLATEIKEQQTMQTLNFFVYLQSLPSREEAEKIIKDMRQNEIKNYRLIESGPYKNAIALGTFDDLDRARRHAEYVRYLGYDAKYTARKKPKEVYWINYDEPFGSNAPVIQWTKKVDPRASVQKIPKECDF